MSYYECPTCGEKIRIFGNSNIEDTASAYNIKTVAKLPINPNFAKMCDAGEIEMFNEKELDNILNVLYK